MNKVFSPRYVVKFKQVKLVYYSELKMVKSERDVLAVRDFITSTRPKPIAVLTCKTSPRTDDRLLIGYSLPDF